MCGTSDKNISKNGAAMTRGSQPSNHNVKFFNSVASMASRSRFGSGGTGEAMTVNGHATRIGTEVAFLGAPVDAGAAIAGAALGPAALREAGLTHRLETLGFRVVDHGDLVPKSHPGFVVDIKGSARNAARVAEFSRALSGSVYNLMCGDVLPIVLGGDHSISMGSVNGVARYFAEHGRELFVLWLDAHADFNTPETTPTGNMHGMPLAFLSGEPPLQFLLANEPRVPIDPRRIWLFGTRAIDRGEAKLLRSRGVNVIEMTTIKQAGPSGLLQNILGIVARENGALHLSFDIDFLDPNIAHGISTPIAEGANYQEARLIMETLGASQLLSSIDIVELNPNLDLHGVGTNVTVDLVAALFCGQQGLENSVCRRVNDNARIAKSC